MPCLWLQHNKSQLFINTLIVDANAIPDLTGAAPNIDIPNSMFRALVDTGAQSTMISGNVAKKLGLRPIGKIPVQGVGGISHHNNYLFHVGFVIGRSETKPGETQLDVNILATPIQGGELTLANAGFDVLLGMDVISTGSLAVEGGGTFSFSF